MIRQAISCDICGAEKKQTNHWFVAYTHAGELRVSGWKAAGRMRTGAKHLCGQTCLHKLVDEFIAAHVSSRVQTAPDAAERAEVIAATDSSLTSNTAYAGPPSASSAFTTSGAGVRGVPVRSLQVMPTAVIAISPPRAADEPRASMAVPAFDDPPNYSSRRWRAEAWERERERERRSSMAAHRKNS
jgi:hypothetical protein